MCLCMLQMHDEFLIAIPAQHTAGTGDGHIGRGFSHSRTWTANLDMYLFIFTMPCFADLCSASFKLRLYQGDDFHIGKLLCQHRKNLPYGDKGYIHAGKIRTRIKHIPTQIAAVDTLHIDNARIVFQSLEQLILSDIHCVDKACFVLQTDIVEASGASTDIQNDASSKSISKGFSTSYSL